jgi:hypothetical protein
MSFVSEWLFQRCKFLKSDTVINLSLVSSQTVVTVVLSRDWEQKDIEVRQTNVGIPHFLHRHIWALLQPRAKRILL